MAFNFNWSPLIADTDRVRDMLTRSLNKSPKPPIIVDDIIVNELNLGSTPPELEILEVGDLAEDKFRGIFKMSYTGDAYLTLKTRVQANPLNTYLSNKPNFASPQPLAASSGLTIPLQITLSDIRLSGFVILVFSKQKGITLVFRNDPLESLKVSSTFDSIPFVREYLQRTIESQLRIFSTEYQSSAAQEPAKDQNGQRAPIDPFASPAQQPTDSFGQPLESSATFSLDAPTETYASFSQKNLLRLAALTESQRTLSLFTPSMRDTVYRAWASAVDRNELSNGRNTPLHRPTLSRIQSTVGSHSAWSSSAPSQASETPSANNRPGMTSFGSAPTVYSLASGAPRSRAGRKRKNRVINLRKDKAEGDVSDVASVSSGYPESADRSATGSAAPSLEAEANAYPTAGLREGEISTPPRSPRKKVGFQQTPETARLGPESASARRPVTPRNTAALQVEDDDQTPRASMYLPKDRNQTPKAEPRPSRQRLTRMQTLPTRDKPLELPRRASDLSIHSLGAASSGSEGSSGGILEQAWMMRMANEIARKVAEEKGRRPTWRAGADEGEVPPPAYVS
ncbi:ERMES complex subunit [Friedmanniomyces endolithicus]|uniref:Mitochondrial distribution and morphology protein 34 n=1 Tax=Friedmanniomyces endolithicus TaxID=329885 RepID=A0AAN6KCA5_9PEZI|nr:ERMES complex subunit [Friedmanniomyces endolithicus]KAK0279698.1 ERMES complex subunit [Friedmanniomyces endolithicus]KAK0294828.1 ERMES complex subunit [Friedmanniomyces endolithicus]KAK0824203.1 ERMES complex subunit [Friedmanniomyces endolithicus]KAK0974205.1 ERMES complex subunit [Friedmanniomyces endolithicus]